MMSHAFELWLEFEEGDPNEPANRPTENFANINITLPDGRRYALNVWTFDFLPLGRYEWPYEPKPNEVPAKYVIPPDLFVERLDRATIESVVAEMIAHDELLNAWLCKDRRDHE
jgi:hypothetical protein